MIINGASLFSSAGIAETYFLDIGINIRVANEILLKRAKLYNFFYPNTNMITGDITDNLIYNQIKLEIEKYNCKFLIATPPCQGMSSLGKKDYLEDKRNYLIFYVFDIIDSHDFDYILIENVPKFLKLYFPYNGKMMLLKGIINEKYSDKYNIDTLELNAADYGVPQSRPRGFVKIFKKGKHWPTPNSTQRISLKEAIGHLQSLESGQISPIKWHFAKIHNERDILIEKTGVPNRN